MPINFIIDHLLLSNELNLIAGGAGAGKTTWVIQLLECLKAGTPFFGYKVITQPTQTCYVALDRPESQLDAKLESMGLQKDFVPHLSLVYKLREVNFKNLYTFIPSEADLIIIDGIEFIMTGNPFDASNVARHLSDLLSHCRDKNRTLILINHSPKQSPSNRYSDPRQRVLGSVAWSAMSSTTTVVEKVEPDDPSNMNRTVWCCSNIDADIKLDLTLTGSRLVLQSLAQLETPASKAILSQFPPGLLVQYGNVIQIAMAGGVSESNAKRSLDYLVKQGVVEKVLHGLYRLTPQN